MGKQFKIRVKKDTILSKKFAKKIRKSYEDDSNKKKKKKKKKKDDLIFRTSKKKKDKKKNKSKFKKPKQYWTKPDKNKSSKKSPYNLHVVSKSALNNTELANKIMKLLKQDMENKIELSKLISKLIGK